MQYEVPILFLIFNRADTARRVFAEIRKQKPKYLYVAADGPRKHIAGEKEKCEQTREIIKDIDWDCELKTLFREENLGCGKAVSGAISWFFENVSEGVILEDDCLPEPTFFRYCQEMLERYREKEKVGIISGNNFLFNKFNIEDSYYFSKIPHIWGWATWRRVWNNYDFNISKWPEYKKTGWLKNIFKKKTARYYWKNIFDDVYSGKINTVWDYQLTFLFFLNNYLAIVPKKNLISNIGFDAFYSTHTKNKKNKFSNMSTEFLSFPLIHPKVIAQNKKADEYIQTNNFCWWKLLIKKTKIGKYIINILRK